jgi:hypothetical protein
MLVPPGEARLEEYLGEGCEAAREVVSFVNWFEELTTILKGRKKACPFP